MADITAPEHAGSRRDFLQILTAAAGVVAAGAVIWPVIDALNPDADGQARAHPIIDAASIAEDTVMAVQWDGLPILIRKLTAQQMADAQAVVPDSLPDPASFASRVKPGYESFVVVVGLNTGTLCALEGNDPTAPRGDFGGWVSPCDGSEYDVLGRVRQGPAVKNLVIPRFTFINAAQIRLG